MKKDPTILHSRQLACLKENGIALNNKRQLNNKTHRPRWFSQQPRGILQNEKRCFASETLRDCHQNTQHQSLKRWPYQWIIIRYCVSSQMC